MSWDREAEKALKEVPFFVRPMVRRKVEERVSWSGGSVVTVSDYREAEARFRSVMTGKSIRELEQMIPRANEPGLEMVAVEVCHNEMSNCPNILIDTSDWAKAVKQWAKDNDISEKLRRRVKEDKVYYHQKLRIAVAGCPNGCSRPQIADIGVVGFVEPEVNPESCISCRACAEDCPDQAIIVEAGSPLFDRSACQGCTRCRDICPAGSITLSEPRVKILAGGKLGRHPHLAEVVMEAERPKDLIPILDRIIKGYIENAGAGERFADYWARTGKEAAG